MASAWSLPFTATIPLLRRYLSMQWPGALGVLCVLGSPYMPITSSLRLAEPTLAFRSPMITTWPSQDFSTVAIWSASHAASMAAALLPVSGM